MAISSLEWIRRCAVRITEVDQDVGRAEARSIALALHDFERTRALDPEMAVAFVAANSPDRGRCSNAAPRRADATKT